MKREFEMSMVGELNCFLGLQVKQRKDGIFISQEKYAKNLVKRFGLDSKKYTSTSMNFLEKLSLDAAGVDVDPTPYQSMIDSLIYLNTSRLDIAFSVGVCAHFQAVPKESYLTAVKRIIRYINGISDYGIWYSKDSNECLNGYSDVDWAGVNMSPFKRAAIKGSSNKGKESIIDVDELSPTAKRTRSSSRVFNPNKFRSYAAF
nr:uncharacterized protein LOC112034899 [Quercus suber]